MIGDSQNPLMATVLGLVVLVMGGIAVGTFVDLRLDHSEARYDIAAEIEADADTLAGLREHRRIVEARWEEIGTTRGNHAAAITAARSRLQELDGDLDALVSRRDELLERLPALAGEFADWRRDHRQQTRDALVGSSHDSIPTRSGRSYEQVTIKAFNGQGIEIRHLYGTARIPFAELTDDWSRRVAWNPADEAGPPPPEAPPEGNATETATETGGDPPPAQPVPETSPAGPSPEEIEKARRDVEVTRLMYQQARNQTTEARIQSSGNRRSPQGSLETWEERISRLEGIEARHAAAYNQARSELRRLSPFDPLLQAP